MAKETPFDRARDFVEEKIEQTKEVLGDSFDDVSSDVRKSVKATAKRIEKDYGYLWDDVRKYVKDNPEFSFRAGVVEGRLVSQREIEALATLPSKEELYSKLLFLMQAPAQRLATVVNAIGRDVAVVLNQGVEKKKFKEA